MYSHYASPQVFDISITTMIHIIFIEVTLPQKRGVHQGSLRTDAKSGIIEGPPRARIGNPTS